MSDPMDDEFDTVAGWTADVALDLGPDHHLPAGCRGSGGPAALSWLLEQLGVRASDRMLDCGAGVGGPSAFAVERTGAELVLAEPEPGACRAAGRLFGLPAVTAPGQDLPFDDAGFDVAWSIAVLCTSDDQPGVLRELRRVLTPAGRLGLLVYVRTTDDLSGGPEGNNFPTDEELSELLETSGFEVTARQDVADLPEPDDEWTRLAGEVDTELERRFGTEQAWQTAQQQSEAFGRLLSQSRVRGRLIAATVR